MTIKQQELLSAFVDGELNEQELDELLALMKTDDSAKVDYMRYQFSSDLLHGYVTDHNHVDLTDRIHQALSDEPDLHINATEKTKTEKVFAFVSFTVPCVYITRFYQWERGREPALMPLLHDVDGTDQSASWEILGINLECLRKDIRSCEFNDGH